MNFETDIDVFEYVNKYPIFVHELVNIFYENYVNNLLTSVEVYSLLMSQNID
jgi:hypothetical protein